MNPFFSANGPPHHSLLQSDHDIEVPLPSNVRRPSEAPPPVPRPFPPPMGLPTDTPNPDADGHEPSTAVKSLHGMSSAISTPKFEHVFHYDLDQEHDPTESTPVPVKICKPTKRKHGFEVRKWGALVTNPDDIENKQKLYEQDMQYLEWVMTAMILDRVFMYCFVVATVAMICVLMIYHP